MIKIHRNTPPKNTILDKKKTEILKKMESLVQSKTLKSGDIEPLWRNQKVKKFLFNSQKKKCCYCERESLIGETEVDHFRPKSAVKERGGHPGYWWLAYEWDNLLIACKPCNNKKGSQFPLEKENKRAMTKESSIKGERPYLINPLKEDPEEFIDYDIPEDTDKPVLMIKAIGKNKRATKTINDLTSINDDDVALKRGKKLQNYKETLELVKIKKEENRIERHISSESSFSAFAKSFFKKEGYLE